MTNDDWKHTVSPAGHRVEIKHPAPTATRFAPGCFDSQIGKVVPLNLRGVEIGHMRLIAADVAGDGLSVHLTYEPATEEGMTAR